MIKEIVTDIEFLKTPSEPATAADAEVAQDLIDTMAAQESCACLAANQIGVLKDIIVYDHDGKARLNDWDAQVVQHAIDHCKGRIV